MADKVWRRGRSGPKAGAWRTHCGQASGMRPEHIAASLFFPRENPTENSLGAKSSIDPKQFFKHRVLVKAEFGEQKYEGNWPVGMQYKRCGLHNGAKEFCLRMPRRCPTAGQERAKSRGKAKALADTWWTKGKADA